MAVAPGSESLSPARVLTPREDRLLRPRGALFVRLVASPAGEKARTVRNLDALGLRRLGDGRYHRNVASTWGMIGAAHHLLEVQVLSMRHSEEAHIPRQIATTIVRGSEVASVTEYQVAGRPAQRLKYRGNQFAACELYEDEFSLTWSCDLPFFELMERLASIVPEDSPTRTIKTDGCAATYVSVREAALREPRQDDLLAAEVDCIGISMTWFTAGSLTRNAGPRAERHGKFGFVADVLDPGLFRELLAETATPVIDGSPGRFEGMLDCVRGHVPTGDLRKVWSNGGGS